MDQYDLLIMRQFENVREQQAKGNQISAPSMEELAKTTGLSIGNIYDRLQELVRRELMQGPKTKKQPRAYGLTTKGVTLLEEERGRNKHEGASEWPPRSTAR